MKLLTKQTFRSKISSVHVRLLLGKRKSIFYGLMLIMSLFLTASQPISAKSIDSKSAIARAATYPFSTDPRTLSDGSTIDDSSPHTVHHTNGSFHRDSNRCHAHSDSLYSGSGIDRAPHSRADRDPNTRANSNTISDASDPNSDASNTSDTIDDHANSDPNDRANGDPSYSIDDHANGDPNEHTSHSINRYPDISISRA